MIKYICLLMLLLMGCSSLDKDRTTSSDLINIKQKYYQYLENTCIEDKYYEGLKNTFQYQACILDEAVLDFQQNINRLAFLWSDEEFYKQQQDLNKSKSIETKVFLSFFSPDKKLVDLDKKSTNWKLYINSNGTRYEATAVIKQPSDYEVTKNLYPAHTHWGTAYMVRFPISIQLLNRKDITFTITSREGYSKKLFPTYNLD